MEKKIKIGILISIFFLISIPNVLAAHPTYLGIAGYLTDTSNNSVGSANVRVNISTSNSCSSGVFWSKLFSNAVSEGVYGITLGTAQELNLSYNQDYYICYEFDDGSSTEVFGAYIFRGGQGEIDAEDINESGDYTFGNARANIFYEAGSTLSSLYCQLVGCEINGNFNVTGNIYHDENITNPYNLSWGYFNNGTCIVIGDLKYVSEC